MNHRCCIAVCLFHCTMQSLTLYHLHQVLRDTFVKSAAVVSQAASPVRPSGISSNHAAVCIMICRSKYCCRTYGILSLKGLVKRPATNFLLHNNSSPVNGILISNQVFFILSRKKSRARQAFSLTGWSIAL